MGYGGHDSIVGYGGNDWLLGGDGSDSLLGGDGNDTLNPGDNDNWDFIQPGAGIDIVDFSDMHNGFAHLEHGDLPNGIDVVIDGSTGNGTGSIDKGQSGMTTLLSVSQALQATGLGIAGTGYGDSFDITNAPNGWIGVNGGDGTDSFTIDPSINGIVRLDFAYGNQGVVVNLGTGTVTNDGYGNTETISGVGGNTRIELRSGNYDDTLIGSAFDDRFILRAGNDYADGLGGQDLVRYDRSGVTAVNVDLLAGLATGVWRGNAFQHTLMNIEDVRGSREDDDTLFGSAAANRLEGRGGDDTLNGWSGDDTLSGGEGDDLMIGGHGSDRFYVDSVGDRVAESRKWSGHDTVISSVDFRMGRKHIEDLELTGTARVGAGNGLMNRIEGNDSDNILDGGKNVDTLIGGLGDDLYVIRSPGDNIVESAGEGVDAVRAYRSYALDAHVEKLYMQNVFTQSGAPANLNGIGNGLDNTIVGTPFANTIVGREGNDVLKGQAGDDTFVFDRAIGANNVDRIIDYEVNGDDDTLKFKASVLGGGVTAGVLDAADFVAGTAALDASDRFIFDQASGQLWFDADGSGAGAQELLATFDQNATVAADDIEIF
jgi:Ca2+-binding RTX toxin-like protein